MAICLECHFVELGQRVALMLTSNTFFLKTSDKQNGNFKIAHIHFLEGFVVENYLN